MVIPCSNRQINRFKQMLTIYRLCPPIPANIFWCSPMYAWNCRKIGLKLPESILITALKLPITTALKLPENCITCIGLRKGGLGKIYYFGLFGLLTGPQSPRFVWIFYFLTSFNSPALIWLLSAYERAVSVVQNLSVRVLCFKTIKPFLLNKV